MESFIGSEETENCYCSSTNFDPHMLTCTECKKRFHPSCLKSGRPSDLTGDIYFKFICANCSADGTESVKRMKLQWTLVIILALYNLQLQGGGKCGYFRWREHICRFIDKNWTVFFGTDRKKSATWHGTVAGSLSTGANRYFVSGMEVLGETGWWSLKSSKLPSVEEIESVTLNIKPNRKRKTMQELTSAPVVEGSRKKNQNIVEAAVALKEKKACIVSDDKISKPRKKGESKTKIKSSLPHKLKLVVPKTNIPSDYEFQDNLAPKHDVPKIIIKSEPNVTPSLSEDPISLWIKDEPKDNIDLDIQDIPDMFDFSAPLDTPDCLNSFLDGMLSEISSDKISIKSSTHDYESEEESSNSCKTLSTMKKVQQHPDTSRKRKAVTKDESPVKETVVTVSKFTLMTPYEEDQLLEKLQKYPTAMKERSDVRRLYRKLVIRKLKREKNIPLFDIDAEMRSIRGMDPPDYADREYLNKVTNSVTKRNNILDRFQTNHCNVRGKFSQHVSFVTRLMGLEDEQQESIVSPYTERVLKPFIFRNHKIKPLKLCLLEEIVSYSNRSNPNWKPPKLSPIDFCYVRPQHIPGINALCHEFFWPGIDLSETLQYPDFSCVALYRKVIIGFAFMVPDVKYNEAYITFIFCHPEWRRAGIATFMLYHLIQTCMGKDVTLHVSATSSAVFLYQKFGFKVEEFIHDFYDKYLPPDSKECRHALFLRLSR
ncbi:cysteine-rich protein 2-binding protein-like [Stegodyphus dumicola]|uniref:cysteine-rich protein 2-binding protein-like n=1 Tax=Stegodyphus dumicola TaxID=202533 RepID=UPI0015AA65E8|nr:cysteine-rich protein 2-binding protein-like [Stegodyphus dumicola]